MPTWSYNGQNKHIEAILEKSRGDGHWVMVMMLLMWWCGLVMVMMLLCGDVVIVKGMVMVNVVLVMVKKVLMVMWWLTTGVAVEHGGLPHLPQGQSGRVDPGEKVLTVAGRWPTHWNTPGQRLWHYYQTEWVWGCQVWREYWTGISPIVENKLLTAGITEEHGALLVPVAVSTGGILVAGRLNQKAQKWVCWGVRVAISEGSHFPAGWNSYYVKV